MSNATKTTSGPVRNCVACHDGGYLVTVSIQKPKVLVAVRSLRPIPPGQHITIKGSGTVWSLAA